MKWTSNSAIIKSLIFSNGWQDLHPGLESTLKLSVFIATVFNGQMPHACMCFRSKGAWVCVQGICDPVWCPRAVHGCDSQVARNFDHCFRNPKTTFFFNVCVLHSWTSPQPFPMAKHLAHTNSGSKVAWVSVWLVHDSAWYPWAVCECDFEVPANL